MKFGPNTYLVPPLKSRNQLWGQPSWQEQPTMQSLLSRRTHCLLKPLLHYALSPFYKTLNVAAKRGGELM